MVRTRPKGEVSQLPIDGYVKAFFTQSVHPAMTVVIARPAITLALRRFLTTLLMTGPAAGPSSAAAGPKNPANRKADPNHRAPPRMWKVRSTIMTGSIDCKPPVTRTHAGRRAGPGGLRDGARLQSRRVPYAALRGMAMEQGQTAGKAERNTRIALPPMTFAIDG